jgi:hypothetical protein
MLHIDTVTDLAAAAEYLRGSGHDHWADAIDTAILLNADMPNVLKEARRAGYDAAISHDCDGEDYAA